MRFTQFCDALNIPEGLCMPTPEWLLSIFITTKGAGSIGGGALRTLLLGLQLWHVINGAPWHRASHLKRKVQGSISAAPATTSHPKCAPITLAHLMALRDNLDFNNTFNAAVFTTATMAFWCQCHLAECAWTQFSVKESC